MYLTEEEAKQKWCPETRGLVASTKGNMYSTTAVNVGEGGRPPCIASDCMMWRETLSPEYKFKAEQAYQRYGTMLEPKGKDVRGYCGLAGRPE